MKKVILDSWLVSYVDNGRGESFSVARDAEEVADDVEVLEVVLFVEVSVMFGFPEATCAHVQTWFSFLQAN